MTKLKCNRYTVTILLCISVLLAGCSQDRCIDADDFGFSKFTISARYDSSVITSTSQGNQVAPWVDSKYRVNGQPLLILVRTWEFGTDFNNGQELSAWCPWYSNSENASTLSTFCEKLTKCEFVGNEMCVNPYISNPPCLMKNGVGLYALIADPNTDPNISYAAQQNPDGITIHLGEPLKGYNLFDISKTGQQRPARGVMYDYDNSQAKKEKYTDSPLYFKILDRYYDDNAGQYRVVIKSGVSDDRPDPVEFITTLVKENLFGNKDSDGLIKIIYLNIINNPAYRLAVMGMLTLYIIFSALSYLTGNLNLTHTELIIRVIKIAIVSALINSKYAWSFFNDYLFVYFIGGVEQMKGMIEHAASGGPGSQSIVGLMIAPQTISKVMALLFMDWRGFIYIILYLAALYFVVMLTLYATILYLTALIAIGMIIVMAPIFICFLLFGITRSLFENWLRQLIGYALQPILLWTGIAFISMIIRTEIYSTLGFRVCNQEFPDLGSISDILGTVSDTLDLGIDLSHSIFYWGFPNPMNSKDFSKARANIPIPMDFWKDKNTFCPAYGCIGNRYIELPFLDPDKDAKKIQNFFNGNFLQFDGLLIIFISLYLLSKFNNFSVSIAQFLSNTSGNLVSPSATAGAAYSGIQDKAREIASPYIDAMDERLGVSRRLGAVRDTATALVEAPFEWLGKKIGGDPEQEALDPRKANAAVLGEVKEKYGLDPSLVKAGAIGDYDKMLNAKLGDIFKNDPARVAELSSKSFAEIQDALASKDHPGRKFSELSAAEKNDLMKTADGDLRALRADAKFAEKFKQAYVDAYHDMSDRGIGLFSKNISAFRTLKEMQYGIKSQKEKEAQERLNKGERFYAGYEGVKRTLIDKVLGKEFAENWQGEITGAAWHDYQYEDPRLRTYSERVEDNQRLLKTKELQERITVENARAGEDIFGYEYQLRTGGQSSDLLRDKIKEDVYSSLSQGEDPVLMGDKFMRERATDSQMRDMIDNAHKIKEEMILADQRIGQEIRYEAMQDIASEKIKTLHDKLATHYNRSDITAEEMPNLLSKMHADQGTNSRDDLESLNQSLRDFDQAQRVLQKVDEHKALIDQEVQQHIDGINKHRQAAGMEAYEGKTPHSKPKVRTVISVNEFLKK